MITTADFKKGLLVEIDGTPYMITDFTFQSPSARGTATLVKVKLKNMLTKQTLEKTFKAGDKFNEPNFESNPGQFLYKEGNGYVFMDLSTYEQFSLSEEVVGEKAYFLLDGLEDVKIQLFNGEPIGIELPPAVELKVIATEPAIKGATAAAQMKPATLETGLQIHVPPYIETGEVVRVDTRTKAFISRAGK
ncbi:MAG: elongation factor P [Acidobacteriota bacterium]|nr:elongation factor P [Blastocatellia bacterium]MDW8411541.1 elongation factor P [Acidobacteriota bacterium]